VPYEGPEVAVSYNKTNMYAVDAHVAEIYDQVETHTEDVTLIRTLIGEPRKLRIQEPFCGTGRILIPLALDGHDLVGVDQAKAMLDRARAKVERLLEDVQRRITLVEADVTSAEWPRDFDLVVLGGNCFYELATPGEQKGCIASAAASLNAVGYVYVDNNHMEGDLDESWRKLGVTHGAFPTGTCSDGARVETTNETVWYDAPRRLVRFRRSTRVKLTDGATIGKEYVQQKHPVSATEVRMWLEAQGFTVERTFGDRDGNPFTMDSGRAIFWARKG
jgi:SAM-dependent methyltransferase